MKIDLTCPVELWHYALPTQQYPVCRLQLFNLTEQTVTSVQAVFSCYDGDGTLISRQVERAQRLNGPARSAFEMAVVIEDGAQAAGMDFSVEKVWFDDGTVWRHAASSVAEYTPNALPASRRLDVLRALAGADALGFPSDQGAVWMCVCGRPNAAGEDTCRRCGRAKRDVFTSYNEATVETVIFEQENAMEERARQERAQAQKLAQEQEAARLKKRRRRRRVWGTVLSTLLVLVLAFGITFHAIPFYRFYTASRQLENGVYASARAGFEALAAERGRRSLPVKIDAIGLDVDLLDMQLYYRSAELAQECTYRQAGEMLGTGTIPALRTAQDAFDSLGDYRDSATLAKEARYQRAGLLMGSRLYENVVSLYDEVGSYRDAPALRSAAVYQWAAQLMNVGEYDTAREKFLSLGSYEDAPRQAQLCLYEPAVQAIENGQYQQALDLLLQLDSGFEGTALRLQEAYYGLGTEAFARQEYDAAAEYFLQAGDYRDAYTQATACLYEPACLLMDSGEYAQAKEMFDKIPAYRDALEKSWQCCEAMGRAAMEAEDYETARAILGEALDYEPAQALLMESYYVPAVALQEAGDTEGALALLDSIQGYRDTDQRIRQMRLDQARQLAENGSYAEALAALEALEADDETEALAQEARYSLALQQLSAGDYAQAIAGLEALDGYATSTEDLHKAYYDLGSQLLADGKVAEAAEQFALAADYEDAREQYQICTYALAKSAIAEGRHEEAAALLEKIPEYADANTLRSASVYQTAEALRQQGQLAEAGRLFSSISGYEDAARKAEVCYDAYYADVYATAQKAMDAKDYAAAITALESVSLENTSSSYADIERMYQEANYLYANQLYDQKKPYEALPYYRNIPEYKDVAKKLDRVCYRMLGKWVSLTGVRMEFRENGTCTIDGKDYYFRGTTFAFYVGNSPDELTGEWMIYDCQGDNLSIQNIKTKSQYKLTREKE